MLKIEKKISGDLCVLKLDGKVDMVTSVQLESEIEHFIGHVKELIIDCTGLVYISSAGLRVLVATQKRMDGTGKLVLKNVQKSVMEILAVTGMSRIIAIE